MKRFAAITTTAASLGALILSAPALAHVTVQPGEVAAGGFTRIDVRVPTEREDTGTEKIELQMPDGFLSASYEPAPGWDIRVVMEELDEPVESEGDEPVTEQVDRIIWTAEDSDAVIGPGEFRDFGLSVRMPDTPGETLTFPALQTYDDGEVVRWIGEPETDTPAAQVSLVAEEEEGAAGGAAEPAAPAESGGAASDDGGGSSALGIAALVVGLVALAVGGAALMATRRRATAA